MIINTGVSCYGSREVIRFSFSADNKTYRSFALLLLSCQVSSLKHPVSIEICHPKSDIKKIIIEAPQEQLWGIDWEIKGFHYEPIKIKQRHPLLETERRPESARDLPNFLLFHEAGYEVGPSEMRQKILCGFGSKTAAITLAKTLLDFGLKTSSLNEVCMESPSMYASVRASSAEAVFWLPGGIGYNL